MFSIILILGVLTALSASAQTLPSCETNCVTSSLSSSGCASSGDQCVCDPAYQNAMLQCLVKPQGGCTYSQITDWMNRIQTQCFMSPPIIPPCLTICPLQAQMAAGCSSDADTTCICGSTYANSATQCIKTACEDQLNDWTTSYQDSCRGQSGTITPSATPMPSGTGVPGISSPHDTVISTISDISTIPTTTGNHTSTGSPSSTSSTGAAIPTHALALGGHPYLGVLAITVLSMVLGATAIL